jgi:hypothetical protein
MTPVRNGHGAGEGTPHVEIPLKDQRPANAEQTALNLAERKRRGKPFQKGNKAAKGRAPTLALLGVQADTVPAPSRADLRKADRYRRRAVCELASAHGHASARTCAIVGSAALVLASQRQVAALAFQTGDPALHKLAADLAEKHSQLEIKAAFVCKDDAAGRPDPALAAMEQAKADFQRRLLERQAQPTPKEPAK